MDKVLFLGLGGTGKEVLNWLKRRLDGLNGGKWQDSAAFLLIDVDDSGPKFAPDVLDRTTEFFQPGQRTTPNEVLDAIRRDMGNGGPLAWIGERIPPGSMSLWENSWAYGTERYRQAGLLALLWEERERSVSACLDAALDRITLGKKDVKLHIFIVCSLCGGTGSGMVLDTALLARQAGLPRAASCSITGVLLLPGVFRPEMKYITHRDLQRNAEAALAELDYYMHPATQRTDLSWDPDDAKRPHVWFDRTVLNTRDRLMEAIFLIDNETNGGGKLGGMREVGPAVADILHHLARAEVGVHFHGTRGDAHGQLSRDASAVDSANVPNFGSLGLARVCLPKSKLALEAAPVLSGDVLTALVGTPPTVTDGQIRGALERLGLRATEDLAPAFPVGWDKVMDCIAEAVSVDPGATRGSPVSASVREVLRQRAAIDQKRVTVLELIEKAEKAYRQVLGSADALKEQFCGQAEQRVRRYVSDLLGEAHRDGRGLEHVCSLLEGALGSLRRDVVEASKGSAREVAGRVEALGNSLRDARDRLNRADRGVARVARTAAAACDHWLQRDAEYRWASVRATVYDRYRVNIERALEAAVSLRDFLRPGTARSLQQQCQDAAVRHLEEWERSCPITETHVRANGRELFESDAYGAARSDIAGRCLRSLGFRYEGGRMEVVGNSGFSLGPSPDPLEPASRWVAYLEHFACQVFERRRLDEHVTDDEEARRLAQDCLDRADVFVRWKASEAQPVSVVIASPPRDTRMSKAFSDIRSQAGATVVDQDDPTSAAVLKAQIGLPCAALRFREESAAIERDLVSTPGVWVLGQVSHNIFWREDERLRGLKLFLHGMAADKVLCEELPRHEWRGSTATHRYCLKGTEPQRLGTTLQEALLKFLAQVNLRQREQLGALLAAAPPAVEKLKATQKRCRELLDLPTEVPSEPLRRVLGLVLNELV